MEFVSPGFGSWTVIEAPDICRVHITESFRTVNTPLPKDLQYQKLAQGIVDLSETWAQCIKNSRFQVSFTEVWKLEEYNSIAKYE